MAEKILKARVQMKTDTEENWLNATNFTPKNGEIIIYAIDSNHSYQRIKIGDGVTLVNNLPFVNESNDGIEYSNGDGLLLVDNIFSVSYGTSASSLGVSSAGTATTVSRSDHVHALPSLTSCTGTLTIEKGGTGSASKTGARENLGITSGTSLPSSGSDGDIFFLYTN